MPSFVLGPGIPTDGELGQVAVLRGAEMAKAAESQIERFLRELMEIERKYANELKNAKTNRQEEVRELLDKLAAEDAHAD
jgi:hypothetical protein